MENSWYIRPYQEEDAEDLFKIMVKGRKNTREFY